MELKDRYDVIVAGAGMGGLTCRRLLANQDKVKELEHKIDQMVYELCGLTPRLGER